MCDTEKTIHLRTPDQNLKWFEMKKDDLKTWKVEYFSNHWSDLPQILNFCWGKHTKIEYCLNQREPPMEDDLKILWVEYFRNNWSDLPKILNLSWGDHTNIEYCLKWRQPPKEDNLKILQLEYLSNHWSDVTKI